MLAHRSRRIAAAFVAVAATLLTLTWPGGAAGAVQVRGPTTPGISPDFIYDQLAYMVTHFQHREAGYAAGSSGHSGFARYWTAEMLNLLGPFGATARSYPFATPGWAGRPTTAPAVNVEITVPGVVEPAQVVVIGCHYDGEADSTQSAFDDASGCAIELGVAQAMAQFWQSQGVYPARTLRFVIFDAEEEGIFGSFSYVNDSALETVPDIVAMFNEEQSGIGYPLRFLGKLANPLMPTHIFVAPDGPNSFYRTLPLSAAQSARNEAFARLMQAATAASFQKLRQIGYQELTYHKADGRDIGQQIFTPAQLKFLPVSGDTLGSSDQIAFTEAGIPDATIVGNYSYYTGNAAPAASYPYDRPQDTIGLMDTFADGGTSQSQALSLALAVPGMLTAWSLSQPGILGQAPAGARPVAAIGSIGPVQPGRLVTVTARGFDPADPRARLNYSWKLGDGASATGATVRHAYPAGHFTLQLTVTAPGQPPRVITEGITSGRPASYRNPYASLPSGPRSPALAALAEGRPLANPAVTLPAGNPGLVDGAGLTTHVNTVTHVAGPDSPAIPISLGILVLAVLLVGWRIRSRF